jgi:hypothetical protein
VEEDGFEGDAVFGVDAGFTAWVDLVTPFSADWPD